MNANERTEYRLEGLVVLRGEPSTEAVWDTWGEFTDTDDPMFISRKNFLVNMKAQAHGDGPQGQIRVLDYRVLKRTVTVTEWEEVQ